VRHASNDAGAMIGIKLDSVLGTSAAGNEREKATADGVEPSASDAAQQLSACACVTTLSEPASGSVDPCIGQAPLLEQQAIRAAGEVCQPAHSAHPAAASVRATTKAVVRLTSRSTSLGCTGSHTGVNSAGACPQRDRAALPVTVTQVVPLHLVSPATTAACIQCPSPGIVLRLLQSSHRNAPMNAPQLMKPSAKATIPPRRLALNRTCSRNGCGSSG
jgi:hypothetical protein